MYFAQSIGSASSLIAAACAVHCAVAGYKLQFVSLFSVVDVGTCNAAAITHHASYSIRHSLIHEWMDDCWKESKE
jgi:hypothetical protein